MAIEGLEGWSMGLAVEELGECLNCALQQIPKTESFPAELAVNLS
jgi:hypothetical protein